MIRVARLIPIFSGQAGGPINHILELTKHLNKYPIKTTIYACSEIDYVVNKRTYLYQEINPNFIIKRFNSYIRFRDYRISFGLLRTLLRDSKNIDIFHSHALRSFQEDIAALVAILKKKKLIITTHGVLYASINYFQHFYKRLYDLTDSYLKNKLLDIDYIAVSKFEIELIKKFGILDEKIHYIPHGIDTNHFKPSDRTEILEQYNLFDKKIILYVGRISKRKGVDILINTFSKLKNEIPNVYLLIVGSDYGFKNSIEKLIKSQNLKKRIIFLGFIPKTKLPKVYSIANVVVYPSKYEIFGHVILEANACEKVVIASDHWGPKELILNGKTGYLTKYGDIEELKEKIIYVLNNEELQKKMGEFAREYVKKNFSWDINAEKHFKLYQKILEK